MADYISGALLVGLVADTVLFLWRIGQFLRRHHVAKLEAGGPHRIPVDAGVFRPLTSAGSILGGGR